MAVYFFTSVSLNYVPKARALALSVKQFHPDARFCLLVSEPIPDGLTFEFPEFDEVTTLDDLAIPKKDSWLFKHNVVETCTALKGIFLETLLQRKDCGSVIYLDPDTLVFSNLSSVLSRFDRASILLTPHSLAPETSADGIFDNEISFLRYGLYNLGFIGVKNSPEGKRFSSWWKERLTDYCYSDLSGGLFTDQRWVDLVPSFFSDVEIIRDPTCNVATWNISNRSIQGSVPDGLTVNGNPLVFYHFSGFDSGAQQKMLDKYGKTMPSLIKLREWYHQRCRDLDSSGFAEMRWRYDFYDNGFRIKPEHRLIYRMRKDLEDAFPTPFTTTSSTKSFYRWIANNQDELAVLPSAEDQVNVFSSKLRKALNFASLLKLKLREATNLNKKLQTSTGNLQRRLSTLATTGMGKEAEQFRRLQQKQEKITSLKTQLEDHSRQIANLTSRKTSRLFSFLRKIENRCERQEEAYGSSLAAFLYWLCTLQIFRKFREYQVVRAAFAEGDLFDPRYYSDQISGATKSISDAAFHYVFLGGAKRGINPSPLFDTRFYLKNNPDVDASEVNPLSHFLTVGARERRTPCRLFDPHFYLSHNPVTSEAESNPLLHFIKTGAQQGFKPTELFDTTYYLENNPDLARLLVNPLAHFIICGAAEGRKPHPLFDTTYYLKTNPAVRDARQNSLEHYLEAGSKLGLKPHPLLDSLYYAEHSMDFDPEQTSALEHFLSSPIDALTDPNPLFDCKFYLDTYVDVRQGNINPLLHYVLTGASEGRKPHPLFDTGYYVRTYPDIVEANLNPLAHFLELGGRERRKPHPLFDTDYYLRTNPDVAADSVNPLVHFLKVGAVQNRQPHLLFDIGYYQAQIQDVDSGTMNPVVHFMQRGSKQGLSPHPLFDLQYYLSENPEVAKSNQSPFIHFLELGIKECRNPNPYFDSIYYVREYSDVFHGKLNPFSHYILKGDKEGRNASRWFDSKYYQEQNPDVARFGNSLAHFISVGLAEGRKPNPDFDPDYYAEQYPDVVSSGLNPLLHFIRFGAAQGRRAVPPQRGTQPPYASASKQSIQKAKPPTAPTDSEWTRLSKSQAKAISSKGNVSVDVIIPVYRGYDVTLACIYNVLTAPVKVEHQVIVINDCSPEPDLVSKLTDLAALGLFTLIHNQKNLGFVATVNKGMSLHPDRDVVLLNSDAYVYGNWLDRLHSASRSEDRVGTLTPFTNNDPTTCTYPRFNAENNVQLELDYPDLDQLFDQLNAHELVDIPTAIGFCMYIRRACLDDVGLFDEEAFGKGNGEENDFSQRAANKGWKNKLAANVFVRHIGAVSFLGEKSEFLKQSAAVLKQRYPEFFPNIKSFYKADPIKPLRRRIDIARLKRKSDNPAVLFVTHDRGGGTERHIRDLIQHWQEHDFQTLIMRSDKRIPDLVHITEPSIPETPNLSITNFSKELPETIDLLMKLNVRHIHVHHLAGFGENAPSAIQEIASRIGAAYDFTVHDYTSICPQINLIDESGKYCGEPEVKACDACVAKIGSPFGIVSVKDWRNRYEALLLHARSVFVPNSDVAIRLSKYFPTVSFSVRTHPEDLAHISGPGAIEAKSTAQSPLKVAVLGAVGPHKGSKILLDCASDALKRKLPLEFVLFGYANNEVELRQLSNVTITGPYDDAAIFDLLEEQPCHISFFPAVWPETFSYTLSIAMKAQLYPVAFDFGAISERLRGLKWGELLELELMDKPDMINDRLLAAVPTTLDMIPPGSWSALYPHSLVDYYGSVLLNRLLSEETSTPHFKPSGTATVLS
jgi:GT2 family glycosyltransferase/glycosyltransferase involved in cell wall biosynthesis